MVCAYSLDPKERIDCSHLPGETMRMVAETFKGSLDPVHRVDLREPWAGGVTDPDTQYFSTHPAVGAGF